MTKREQTVGGLLAQLEELVELERVATDAVARGDVEAAVAISIFGTLIAKCRMKLKAQVCPTCLKAVSCLAGEGNCPYGWFAASHVL